MTHASPERHPAPPEAGTGSLPGEGFVRSRVEVDGYTVGVLRAGTGPALVVCPGSAGSDPSWAKDQLARHYEVIELNPPGWGGTPPLAAPMDQKELARLLAKALSRLGVRSCYLHGASVGGVTALWLAAQHPERVRAVSLEGGMNFVAPQYLRNPAQIAVLQKMVESDNPEGDGYPISAPHPRKPWATPAFYREQVRKRVSMLHRLTNHHEQELKARLRSEAFPVLALLGDQDELLLASHLEVWQEFSQVRTVLVPGAAHDIQNTEPEALVDLLQAHYATAPATVPTAPHLPEQRP